MAYSPRGSYSLDIKHMNKNGFNSPDEVYVFINHVIAELQAHGIDAKPLQEVQTTAYTTSSEWLGDLGVAITKIQKQKIRNKDIMADLERLLDLVHKVWPKI